MLDFSTSRSGAVVMVVLASCALGCVEQRIRRDFERADRDLLRAPGMTVVLCGTGTALPNAHRAGPCTAVIAAGRFFLVDAGRGAMEASDLAGLPMADLHAVLLTKFLTDDVADLGEVMTRTWIAGRRKRLAVYGPPGTRRVVGGVVDAHRFDAVMRSARHEPQYLDPDVALVEAHEFSLDGPGGSATVLEEDDLRITAFSVGAQGGIPSVGYRFDHAGRSIVIAGHAMHQPNLVAYATGADVLVHEAVSLPMVDRALAVLDGRNQQRWSSLLREVARWHPSATDAAEVAREAGVGVLVLTRLAPVPASWFERRAFMRGVREIFPHAVLGEDGMRMHLVPREPAD